MFGNGLANTADVLMERSGRDAALSGADTRDKPAKMIVGTSALTHRPKLSVYRELWFSGEWEAMKPYPPTTLSRNDTLSAPKHHEFAACIGGMGTKQFVYLVTRSGQ